MIMVRCILFVEMKAKIEYTLPPVAVCLTRRNEEEKNHRRIQREIKRFLPSFLHFLFSCILNYMSL